MQAWLSKNPANAGKLPAAGGSKGSAEGSEGGSGGAAAATASKASKGKGKAKAVPGEIAML